MRLGQHLPRPALSCVSGWLSDGYLLRCFPPGASEEAYELSQEGRRLATDGPTNPSGEL